MIQKDKIGIIGCGWLGLPLAKLFLKNDFLVKGSTTSKEKIKNLKSHNIEPHLIEIKDTEIFGDVQSFLKDLDVLIINIPPKMKSTPNNKYLDKIKLLDNEIKAHTINKIIFISSTSVYGSNQKIIDSNTEPIPNSAIAVEILKSEKIIAKENTCTIIRFGGLIGANRHPVYSLLKKDKVFNPDAPINLIHLEDCLQIIYSIIEKKAWGKTYLGVSPYHPKKREYYNNKCKSLGLKNINFVNINSVKKEIDDTKIQTELKHIFIHPEL